MASLKQVLLLWLFTLLPTVVVVDAFVKRDGFIFVPRGTNADHLFARQGEVTEDPMCRRPCDVDTCGTVCPVPPRQRSFDMPKHGWDYPQNNTTQNDYSRPHIVDPLSDTLEKRVWTRPNSDLRRTTMGAYLVGQLINDPPLDRQFRASPGFIAHAGGVSNMGTLGYQRDLGTTPFQLGSGGLHGCTMLVVVSRRAVYMAHIWEGYAFNRNDIVDDRWEEAAVNAITGRGTQDPLTFGDSLDPDKFNVRGDNTQIMIMTPRDGQRMRYPTKVQSRIQTVRDHIGRVGIRATHQYQPLEYKATLQADGVSFAYEGRDAHLVDSTERGLALFQYDGDGRWRVMLEHAFYSNVN